MDAIFITEMVNDKIAHSFDWGTSHNGSSNFSNLTPHIFSVCLFQISGKMFEWCLFLEHTPKKAHSPFSC